jgi:hypothetical protein
MRHARLGRTNQCALDDAHLNNRLTALGFDQHHLRQTLVWICEHAPLTIHFDLAIRQALLHDTQCGLQFETGTSRGKFSHALRTETEATLFGTSYNNRLPPIGTLQVWHNQPECQPDRRGRRESLRQVVSAAESQSNACKDNLCLARFTRLSEACARKVRIYLSHPRCTR